MITHIDLAPCAYFFVKFPTACIARLYTTTFAPPYVPLRNDQGKDLSSGERIREPENRVSRLKAERRSRKSMYAPTHPSKIWMMGFSAKNVPCGIPRGCRAPANQRQNTQKTPYKSHKSRTQNDTRHRLFPCVLFRSVHRSNIKTRPHPCSMKSYLTPNRGLYTK